MYKEAVNSYQYCEILQFELEIIAVSKWSYCSLPARPDEEGGWGVHRLNLKKKNSEKEAEKRNAGQISGAKLSPSCSFGRWKISTSGDFHCCSCWWWGTRPPWLLAERSLVGCKCGQCKKYKRTRVKGVVVKTLSLKLSDFWKGSCIIWWKIFCYEIKGLHTSREMLPTTRSFPCGKVASLCLAASLHRTRQDRRHKNCIPSSRRPGLWHYIMHIFWGPSYFDF